MCKVCIPLLAVLIACTAAPTAARSDANLSPRRAYELKVRQLERIFASRDDNEVDLQSLYTSDSVLVEADGNTIVGQGQIVEDFRNILKSGAVIRFQVTTTTFRTDGRLSYAGGVEEIDEREGTSLHHVRHRFLDVMKRQADGTWRFAYILEAAA